MSTGRVEVIACHQPAACPVRAAAPPFQPRSGRRSAAGGATCRAVAAKRHVWLLQTLHHVTATIAARDDVESAGGLQLVTDEIYRRFRFASVGIGVVAGDEVRFDGIASGAPLLRGSVPLTRGVTGRVARTGVGVWLPDARQDPDFLLTYVVDDGRVASEICVPITVDGAVYGVINVEADAADSLGRAEFDVLTTLASSLGLAIERSRRRAAELRRATQLANLQQLTARIGGRAHVSSAVGDILDEAFRLFDYFAIALGLIHGDVMHVHRRYRDWPPGVEPFHIKPYRTGVTARVIHSGEPAFVRDVTRDPDYYAVVPEVRQEICVPIRVNGALNGVLDFEMDASRQLDDSDLDVALMLADCLGIALEQETRFAAVERRNRQLQTLQRVTAVIARQTLVRESFGEITRAIEDAFEFGGAGIGIVDGDRVVFPAIELRLPGDEQRFRDIGIPRDAGVIGRVIRSGRPAVIPDVRLDPDFIVTSEAARSEICVPITVDGGVVGVVNVETPETRPIDAADLEVLTIIANHLGIAIARGDLYAAERRSRREVEGMQRVSRIVASTLDPSEALRRIVDTLAEAFGYPFVSFLLVEGDALEPAASHGFDPGVFDRRFDVGQHVVGRVAATGRAVFVRDVAADPAYVAPRPDTLGEICVPIFCSGALAGVLNVEGTPERRLTEHDLELLQTFAEHAGTLLNNARLYEEMRLLATRDPLTGLANRRAFEERLRAELRRAARYGRPLALLIIDVDRFKAVNDEHGHPASDAVLRELADRLGAILRQADILARYAGDEFAAILPEATRSRAEETARRLSAAVRRAPFSVPADIELSIGVACYPREARDEAELVDAADRAMYQDKRPRRARP